MIVCLSVCHYVSVFIFFSLLILSERFVSNSESTCKIQYSSSRVKYDNNNFCISLLLFDSAINSGHFRLKRENVKVIAPVTNAEKVLCVGMNYKDHCEEQGAPVPEEPVIFSKFNSSVIGPTDDIVYPQVTQVISFFHK